LIRQFFNTKELLGLITSNFYSILYYNSEVWNLPTIKPQLKQQLVSASGRALKACTFKSDPEGSFIGLHKLNHRTTPNRVMIYKHALMKYKLYNYREHLTEWSHLNFQHQF
jgi:hypothetical protein